MFNHALKATVDNLCVELAALLAAAPLVQEAAARSPRPGRETPHQPPGDVRPAAGSQAPAAVRLVSVPPVSRAGAWWPAELGMPAASGAQNALRYAYFPAQRRLAIAVHEDFWLYDTLDHQVSGVSQQQGPVSTVTFTSQHGVVEVPSLPLMASGRLGSQDAGASASMHPAVAPAASPAVAAAQATDILATLERLAALRDKGILSEEEFAAKKTELLRRL
jgi:hypothetical protein